MSDSNPKLWHYRARVDRVIDGDTLVVVVDLGFRTFGTHSIRLSGYDAPELFSGTDREAGKAARERLADWVEEHADGCLWPFTLETFKDKQSFNRYVGVLTCREGHVANTAMAEAK